MRAIREETRTMANIEPLTSIESCKRALEVTMHVLEDVMSSEPDMPGHTQTMADADQWLDALRAAFEAVETQKSSE
jgi:hypothetical protein